MNWFIRTLAGAVIGGLGWKLGADAYEVIKKRVQERKNGEAASDDDDAEEGAASASLADGDGDGDGDRTEGRVIR